MGRMRGYVYVCAVEAFMEIPNSKLYVCSMLFLCVLCLRLEG